MFADKINCDTLINVVGVLVCQLISCLFNQSNSKTYFPHTKLMLIHYQQNVDCVLCMGFIIAT